MADPEQTPQGAIPPKVTPFVKPEGEKPAAMTPAGSAPRPITVRLKPVAPSATQPPAAQPATSGKPAVGVPTPPGSPRATSRVPVPEAVAQPKSDAAGHPATVRLRPVTPAAVTPAAPKSAAVTPVAPKPAAVTSATVSTRQPQPPPKPGAHPLPDGPKPSSPAQAQAAKSKTSRISLESAIGVAPVAPMGADKNEPKTIRLKRPADLVSAVTQPKRSTTPIRQTSRIPDSALPTVDAAAAASSSITQKKTLKIKRPDAKPAGEGTDSGEDAFPEGVHLTPISEMALQEESTLFTAIAAVAGVAAALVLLLLTLCLGAHAMGPNAGRNALASIKGPQLPWAGRIGN